MSKFIKGDKVIIKSTIGTTNEVCEVITVIDKQRGVYKEWYVLSNHVSFTDDDLELWNPKKDLNGEYGMKIDMNKKYRTRDGRDVEIIAIYDEINKPVIGHIKGESNSRCWYLDGIYFSYDDYKDCVLDLIEVTPYADFKVDDKVLVLASKNNTVWYKRYFAGLDDDGNPVVFSNGLTSWSTTATCGNWANVIRWEDRTPDMEIYND